jgi:hypothetical protein
LSRACSKGGHSSMGGDPVYADGVGDVAT